MSIGSLLVAPDFPRYGRWTRSAIRPSAKDCSWRHPVIEEREPRGAGERDLAEGRAGWLADVGNDGVHSRAGCCRAWRTA